MDGESATDSTGDPAPVDDGSGGDPTPDTATPDEGNENSVTAAVRDKVNESLVIECYQMYWLYCPNHHYAYYQQYQQCLY